MILSFENLILLKFEIDTYLEMQLENIYRKEKMAHVIICKVDVFGSYSLQLKLEFCDLGRYDGQKSDVRVDHARTDCRISRNCAAECAAI